MSAVSGIVETSVRIAEGDAPATHLQICSDYHWRKGSRGFAECNPGHGNPRLRQEWLVTLWKNHELDAHPFRKIDEPSPLFSRKTR